MSTQTPIVNAGTKYCNGLGITWRAEEFVTVYPGAARDSTNTNDIVLPEIVDLNGLVVGPNGCDIEVLQASTLYSVYVIGDSTKYKPTATLLSALPEPSLPVDYDMYRRIGYIRTDSSANMLRYYQYGEDESRVYYYEDPVSVLSGGNSTTYAEINLDSYIPHTTDTLVILDVSFSAAFIPDIADIAPYSWRQSTGLIRFGYGTASDQVGSVTVPTFTHIRESGAPGQSIVYKVTAGTDSLGLKVIGFWDYLR